MTDAHALLGIAPDADADQIKRAFRRLAMRWHPDRNPDPAAHEHFKALRAACDALLAKREEAVPRGADRRQDLILDLEEAFTGGEIPVAIREPRPCEVCGGSGEEVLAHSRLCAACHGCGRMRNRNGLSLCRSCTGRGYVKRQNCSACAGSGSQRGLRTLLVKLPPGLVDGDELRVAGQGEPRPAADGRPGDLRLRIVLAPHPLFRLSGRDLMLTRPVSALRLLAGGELAVPVPGGVRHLRIPAGRAETRTLRLEGGGFPGRRGGARGDLFIELVPHWPLDADARTRALFAQLDAAFARDPARHLPMLAEWEARWLPPGDTG